MTYRKFSLVEPPFPNIFVVFRNCGHLSTFRELRPLFSVACGLFAPKYPRGVSPPNIPFFIKCFWTGVHTLSAAKPFVFNLLWNLEYSGGRCMVGHLGPLSFLKISSGGLRLTNW